MTTLDTHTARRSFVRRMLGASMLIADTYEEVEADRGALSQAFVVVLLACLAAGIGFWLRLRLGHTLPPDSLPLSLQLGVVVVEPFVLWTVGSAFAYMVGSSFFRGADTETDYAEVLRTTGFAFTPAMLAGAAFVPPDALGLGILVVARLWTLLACVIAIRQALDFDTPRAIGTFGIAALLLWVTLWGLSVAPFPV